MQHLRSAIDNIYTPVSTRRAVQKEKKTSAIIVLTQSRRAFFKADIGPRRWIWRLKVFTKSRALFFCYSIPYQSLLFFSIN